MNEFSKFNYETIDHENIEPDFLFIFQAPFLSTSEKNNFRDNFYQEYLANKKYYDKNYILFSKYKGLDFKFSGVFKNKDDIDEKYENKDYTTFFLQINSETRHHIYNNNILHPRNFNTKSKDKAEVICTFSFSNNLEDDVDDKLCTGNYLIDSGSTVTDLCLEDFYDFQNLCFCRGRGNVEIQDKMVYLKGLVELFRPIKVSTAGGIIYVMEYELVEPIFIRIGINDYVPIKLFVLRIPIIKTFGIYWSPQRMFSREKNAEDIPYILGTDVLYRYVTQSVPVFQIDNKIKADISIIKIPLKADKINYTTLAFESGTTFIKLDEDGYYLHYSMSKVRRHYTTTKSISVICFNTENEFNNYINGDNKILDGAYLRCNDVFKFYLNSEDFLRFNRDVLEPKGIEEDLCGSGFIYANYTN